MMSRSQPHPDQLYLDLDDPEIEELIERRVDERLAEEAFLWRFRLIIIESWLIFTLVIVLGLALDLPFIGVFDNAAMVGVGCFLGGLFLLLASDFLTRFIPQQIWARVVRWWRRP
jgi:hypothetical protein